MDVLLCGILSSNHTDQLKKQLMQKIADKGAVPQDIKIVNSVFELTVNWYILYLDSDSDLASTEGLSILNSWAKHNLSTLEQFFNREYLVSLLSRKCLRESNVPILIKNCLLLLNGSSTFYSHLKCIQAMAINYIQEHPSMRYIVNFINLLKSYKECIPQGELHF